jgi:DNA-directed RNA polymerase specialized sigma24 family protein
MRKKDGRGKGKFFRYSEVKQRVCQMRKQGLTYAAIAEKFGCSVSTVHKTVTQAPAHYFKESHAKS